MKDVRLCITQHRKRASGVTLCYAPQPATGWVISLLTWPLLRFLPDFSFRNQPRAFCSPPERCPLSRGRAVFRFKAHVSLTYSVKVFMSIQPAIVLTIISCSTPSSHQVSLRSFFLYPQTI